MREVLFICTGNYYRSRYAEAVFNHEATRRGLKWRAFSRGLAVHLAPPGGISPYTRERMKTRGIAEQLTGAWPVQVAEEDLKRAARTVALKGTEHRPLMNRLQPAWEDRIEYWEIHDLDLAQPDEALGGIEREVQALVEKLAGASTPPAS